MKTILLSFKSDSFARLQSGTKNIEFRKNFPKGYIKVYFYVSKPIMSIAGIAYFDERQNISDLLNRYFRGDELKGKVEEKLRGNRFGIPIKHFQNTNMISLEKLRQDTSNFVVPRMYYFIDNSELLRYLEQKIVLIGQPVIHDTNSFTSSDVFRSANIKSIHSLLS